MTTYQIFEKKKKEKTISCRGKTLLTNLNPQNLNREIHWEESSCLPNIRIMLAYNGVSVF